MHLEREAYAELRRALGGAKALSIFPGRLVSSITGVTGATATASDVFSAMAFLLELMAPEAQPGDVPYETNTSSTDDDGLLDSTEGASAPARGPQPVDTDDDGLLDSTEGVSAPARGPQPVDTDDDGLLDSTEGVSAPARGPQPVDTDDDGLLDSTEGVSAPARGPQPVDTDDDGLLDSTEGVSAPARGPQPVDTDDDGLLDSTEGASAPARGPQPVDTDDDGLLDSTEGASAPARGPQPVDTDDDPRDDDGPILSAQPATAQLDDASHVASSMLAHERHNDEHRQSGPTADDDGHAIGDSSRATVRCGAAAPHMHLSDPLWVPASTPDSGQPSVVASPNEDASDHLPVDTTRDEDEHSQDT